MYTNQKPEVTTYSWQKAKENVQVCEEASHVVHVHVITFQQSSENPYIIARSC